MQSIITIVLIILIIVCVYNLLNKKEGFESNGVVVKKDNMEILVGPNQKYFTYPDSPMTDLAGAIPLDFDYKDYYKTQASENKDLVYYYNDVVDDAKIVETAYDVANGIDKVDYGKVKTGMDKCKDKCRGVCYEGGYTGTATCYPLATRPFDWGTLYKNPTFTYGYNAWNDLDNIRPA